MNYWIAQTSKRLAPPRPTNCTTRLQAQCNENVRARTTILRKRQNIQRKEKVQ